MLKKHFHEKWHFYVAGIVFFLYLAYRFYDESSLMWIFPLDYVNDISSYIAQLFFLDKCGYGNICPYWYNGFINFQLNPPGWYFFAYPLYLLLGSALAATYWSMMIMYIIALLLFLYWGRKENLSLAERTFFFLFFLGNAIAIGNFIRLGRVHELFAWVLFIAFAFLILGYKDKKIGWGWLSIAGLYAAILISHQTVAILSGVLLFCLFLVKNWKERLKIFLALALALLLGSFWLYGFIVNFFKTQSVQHVMTATLFLFDKRNIWQNIATFIIPAALFVIFYFYYQSRRDNQGGRDKKELIFFLPVLLLAFLLLSRLIFYIPLLKYVYPDPYMIFFAFFMGYLFLKTPREAYPSWMRKLIPYAVVFVAVVSVLVNIVHTPAFPKYSEVEHASIEMLQQVEGSYIIFSEPDIPTYSRALYAYGPVMLNLTTAQGWYPHVKEKEYIDSLNRVEDDFKDGECGGLLNGLKKFRVDEVISYREGCSTLKMCGLEKKAENGIVCLYKHENS